MTYAPNVLLLDHDHMLRRATALLLANRGAGVSAAATLDEAIDLCRRCAYDVALIELEPPLPDAAEVLDRFRAELLPPRRIVVCSDAPIPGDGVAGEVLLKPYPFDRLLQLVFGAPRSVAQPAALRRAWRSPSGGRAGRGSRPIKSLRRARRAQRRLG